MQKKLVDRASDGHMRIRFGIAIALALGCAGLTPVARAATYYASPDGTSSGGGTEASPYDIATGISKLRNNSNTLILKSGTYRLSAALALSGGGCKILGETGDPRDVILDGQGTVSGVKLANKVLFAHVTVSNCQNTAAGTDPQAGIRVGNPTDYTSQGNIEVCIVSNCVITHCCNMKTSNPSGVAVVYYDGLFVDSVVRNNDCADRCSGVTLVGEYSKVRRCTIENNTASSGSGFFSGIYAPNSLGNVVDCIVQSNTASGYGPGIIYAPSISGTTVRGNSVPAGHSTSGVWAPPAGEFTMTNCIVEGNTADLYAAGLRLNSSNAAVSDCVFRGNTASGGGAVYIPVVSESTFDQCTFADNVAVTGAAVCVNAAANIRFAGCTFTGNTATYGGAVTVIVGAKTAFDGCTFAGNADSGDGAGNYSGGAICGFNQSANGKIVCSNCVFASNASRVRGGAIGFGFNARARSELVNCIFTNNNAAVQGGAIYVRDNKTKVDDVCPLFIRNCLVANNWVTGSSTEHQGGGICLISSNAVVDACTVVSNRTNGGVGAGLFHRWGGSVTNSIIAFNTVKGALEMDGSWCLAAADASVRYSHSLAWPAASDGFKAGEGCIIGMPRFTDPANGDFTLRSHATLGVDAGINEAWMAGACDLAGTNRIYNAVVDMGAYEYSFPARGTVMIVQ